MKFAGISILLAFSLAQCNWALQCFECVGSQTSDCAKGLAGAAVAVNCEPKILRVQTRTGVLRTVLNRTLEVVNEFVPLPEEPPFVPIPACVLFTKIPYNGRDGDALVHRRCLVSGENFCNEYLQRHANAKCEQCNAFDFCL